MSFVTRRENRPRLRHTAKPTRFSPFISAEMLTIAACTRADRAERASMMSVPTDVRGIQEADIDGDEQCEDP